MDRSQIHAYLRKTYFEGWLTRRLLASLHRGEAFTRVFSFVLLIIVGVQALFIGSAWLINWARIYHDYERFELVLAFVDQFFMLGMLAVLLHVTYLRALHLRDLPRGQFVTLQAAALLLRGFGECVLIWTAAMLGHSILNVADPNWLVSLRSYVKAGSVLVSGWSLVIGFLLFTVSYTAASAIDVFLAIERNSRRGGRAGGGDLESVGHGVEVHAPNRSTVSV